MTTPGEVLWSRAPKVAFVDDGVRVVLLALHSVPTTRPHILDGSARDIWQALDRHRSTLDIAGLIKGSTDTSLEHVLLETEKFLERLQELGLAGLDSSDAPGVTCRRQQG